MTDLLNHYLRHFDKAVVKQAQKLNSLLNTPYVAFVLIFILIVINLLITIAYDGFSRFYNFDEYVVTLISLQTFDQFWNTLESEPHPPGFYVLLKVVGQVFPPFFSLKMAMKIVGTTLLAVVAGYFYIRRKLFTQLHLEWGVIFLLSSFNLLSILSSLKQDIITFPLFLLVFFLSLEEVITKRFSWKRELVITVIITLLFFSGYLNYFFAMVWLVTTKLLIWKSFFFSRPSKFILYGLHGVLALSYLLSFGYIQWQTNQTRFTWINNEPNNFFLTFSEHLIGLPITHPLALVSCMGMFILVIYILLQRKNLFRNVLQQKVFFTVLILSILFTVFCYITRLFAQVRYPLPLFFLLSILAGWGASLFPKKEVVIVMIIFLFSCRTAIYLRGNNGLYTALNVMVQNIEQHIQDKEYGFIGSSPSGLLYTKLQFFKDHPHLIPMLLFYPGVYENASTFGREQLLYMDSKPKKSTSEIQGYLKNQRFTNFIYLNTNSVFPEDPYWQVLDILKQSCILTDQENVSNTNIEIYYFGECSF